MNMTFVVLYILWQTYVYNASVNVPPYLIIHISEGDDDVDDKNSYE